MTMELTILADNFMIMKISGQHTKEDAVKFREESMKLDSADGSIKVLAILEDFEGWEEADWDDARLAEADQKMASGLEKVAFVGQARWEEPAKMLMGYPFTSTVVRYFKPPSGESEAREWLTATP